MWNKLDENSEFTVGFLGLGLIGGSMLKRLREKFPHMTTVAYNRSPRSLELALAEHTVDVATHEVNEVFADCDFIFLCTPVEQNVTILQELKSIIKDSCIISDVGSVKGNIARAAKELRLEKNFIGGHPMAGSEKTGYENATSSLMENAFYAITPFPETSKEALECYTSLVEATGAIPVILDAERHDYVVAAISHVPHLIASSLVNLVKDSDDEEQHMKLIAAGGFKDITRIASSSPNMWQQICDSNANYICELLDCYIKSLTEVRDNLLEHNPNYVYDMFDKSKTYRDSFSESLTGPLTKHPSL